MAHAHKTLKLLSIAMRHFLSALSICFFSHYAQAAPVCAQNFLELGNMASAIDLLRSYKPLMLEQMRGDQCKPKTVSHMALGTPVCTFGGEVPVESLALLGLAESGSIIGAMYLIPYSDDSHARLLAALRKDYQEVPKDRYIDQFKENHEDLTAMFRLNGHLIALTRPSKGKAGPYFSWVSFIEEPSLALLTRNVNLCE